MQVKILTSKLKNCEFEVRQGYFTRLCGERQGWKKGLTTQRNGKEGALRRDGGGREEG